MDRLSLGVDFGHCHACSPIPDTPWGADLESPFISGTACRRLLAGLPLHFFNTSWGTSYMVIKPQEPRGQAMLANPALEAGLVQFLPPVFYLFSNVGDVLFLSGRESSYHFPRHLIGFPWMFGLTHPWNKQLQPFTHPQSNVKKERSLSDIKTRI